MRPTVLFGLFAPLSSLRGIGPRLEPLFKKLCGKNIIDILWHLPTGTIDRSYCSTLTEVASERIVTLTVTIDKHLPPRTPRLPYRIAASDTTDDVIITYFNAKGDYLSRLYPVGSTVLISGYLERYKGKWSMNHPDYVVPISRRSEIPRFEPIYPLTEGLTGRLFRKSVQLALEKVPELAEWHSQDLVRREAWDTWKKSVIAVHNPEDGAANKETTAETVTLSKALRRLAYDELLADQLGLAVIRRHHRQGGGRSLMGDGTWQTRLQDALPFMLTPGQSAAVKEINEDMSQPKRMLRLLQGDVGSGKTVVALLAMLRAGEAGTQSALMAPTEILAKQHHARLKSFLAPLGIEIGLIVGKSRGAPNRAETLASLATGTLKLVVGTHALFQDDVIFRDLGLAVIDEQHRFGVSQRLQLSEKGRGVDILVMTATPIPRTLTLTAFGDMDVSRLPDKPAGRLPIDTRIIEQNRLDEVIQAVKRQLDKGSQVYWVCPLVEESELIDLTAATERAAALSRHFGPGAVGILHGQMATDEKDRTMASFIHGDIRVLVATTVIEVGVDVPNASLMIVEHSERFGLAQLHQLRGRVGRGTEKSNCLLLYQGPLGETAKARLKLMRETEDGFLIAEEDLRLRGPGEVLGTRQSGLPEFRLANLVRDQDLLAMAHDDALVTLQKDPELTSGRGQALRTLLYLFEQDAAVPLLRAG